MILSKLTSSKRLYRSSLTRKKSSNPAGRINAEGEKYRYYLQLFHIDETKRVDQLSSGMRVKYLLALALSHNARLLLLDEPTSGLDPVSRDELVELFRAKGFCQ